MQKDDNRDARPSALPGSPVDSDHDASSNALPPSSKLRDKLNKLANWRLDLSSIEFVEGAPKVRGGYATVSRAFLVSPSRGQDRASQFNPTRKDGLDLSVPPAEASRRPKDVAVKKMNMSDESARVLGLTLREAEFLVGLSHENIIKLEGFVEDLSKDIVWLVFPWAENGNLKDFIASEEWEIPERISLIADLASGVEYLHSRQPPIRHGDLKSINILVNSKYRAVITDFGSARRQTTEDLDEETSHAENKPQPTLSLEPTFCGATNTMTLTLKGDHFTLRWAAPELLHKKKAILASDIWALGCVVYEVMTNSIPFQDVGADTAVVIRVVMGDLPSITNDARMALLKVMCSLVVACWSMDPRQRPTAENCRKWISWMPITQPNPIRTADSAASRARSPALLMQLGHMYRQQCDYVNASDLYAKALDSYRKIGDRKGKAAALAKLAQVHKFRDEYSQAATFYSEALQIQTDIGDRSGRASTLAGLADVHRLQDEYTQAVAFYTEVLQIYTDIGDLQGRATALSGLAEVHRLQDEYTQAVAFYTEALQIRTDIGDRKGRANALWGLADVHRLRTEYSQAMTFYSEDLQIRTDIGDRQGRADALWGLAEVHRLQKHYNQAIQLFSEALQIQIDVGDRAGGAWTLMCLAHVHRDQDQHEDSTRLYEQAAGIFGEIGNTRDAETALYRAAKARQQLEPTKTK